MALPSGAHAEALAALESAETSRAMIRIGNFARSCIGHCLPRSRRHRATGWGVLFTQGRSATRAVPADRPTTRLA